MKPDPSAATSDQPAPSALGTCATLHQLWSRLPSGIGYVLVGILVVAALAGSLLLQQAREYEQTEAAIYAGTGNLAHGFAENLQRSLEAIDQTLLYVRDDFIRDPAGFDLRRWTRLGPVVGRQQIRISVIDAKGGLRTSTLLPASGRVDLADSEIRLLQKPNAEDVLSVGLPLRVSGSGRWALNLSRPILLPDGKFGGLVLATVTLDYFTRFYETLDLSNTTVTLIGSDGIVRAQIPPVDNAIAQPYRDAGADELLLAESDHNHFSGPSGGTSGRDSRMRLYSYNRVQDYPLVVLVGLDEAAGFATYYTHQQVTIAAGLAVLLLLLAIAMVMIRQHRTLTASETALSLTLENISQGIVMIDAKGMLPVWNHRAADLLGVPREFRNSGTSYRDILRWQIAQGEFGTPDQIPADILNALRTGVPRQAPGVAVRTRANGTVVEIRSTALPNGGSVRTFTDISELKRNERALALARDAAEDASRARAEFLAVMSHEIRTPMNGIIGVAGLLLDMKLADTEARYVRIVLDSGQHLLQLINDILDFSRLDAGRLDLEAAPFELGRAVSESLDILTHQARAKGLSLATEIATDVPATLIGDSHRLRQILLNLVGNGIKFTSAGSVRVRVSLLRDETDAAGPAARIGFSVIDTGIGIAPQAISRLFQEFTQVDSSISRRFGGSGLGLAISRRLVEQMGGGITVESEEGIGSTFRFDVRMQLPAILPATNAPAPAPAPAIAETPRPGLDILVAEDNPTNRLVVTRMLERDGHKVTSVENGALAVEAVSETRFDLVVMDVMMPEMDGITATIAIRRLPDARARIPIIALTANLLAEDRERCLQSGMDFFETKPISAARLRAVIEAAHRPPSPQPTAVKPNAPARLAPARLTPARPTPARLAPEPLAALIAQIGADATQSMVGQFIDDSRAISDTIATMVEANRTALIAHQADLLQRAAGNVGLQQLAAAAAALRIAAETQDLQAMPNQAREVQRLLRAGADALREWSPDAHPLDKTVPPGE